LIDYSIQAAKASSLIDQFYVSTDDDEIEKIALSFNCPVIKRPGELAEDDTSMVSVVKHAFQIAKKTDGLPFDFGIILQPTTPLRTGEDIDNALMKLINTKADSVISVYRVFDHHPMRMYNLEDDKLTPYSNEEPNRRLRQDLPPVYHRNGAIYAFRRELVEKFQTLIGYDTRPYIMPANRSINIDEEMDLILADLLLSKK